eukprot:Ihof_evm2s245 gene=Ihof_evmTU2s245
MSGKRISNAVPIRRSLRRTTFGNKNNDSLSVIQSGEREAVGKNMSLLRSKDSSRNDYSPPPSPVSTQSSSSPLSSHSFGSILMDTDVPLYDGRKSRKYEMKKVTRKSCTRKRIYSHRKHPEKAMDVHKKEDGDNEWITGQVKKKRRIETRSSTRTRPLTDYPANLPPEVWDEIFSHLVLQAWALEKAGVTITDLEHGAQTIIKLAAHKENNQAAHFYGMMLVYVVGTPVSIMEGVRQLASAASRGYMPSYFSVAILTHNRDAACFRPIFDQIEQGAFTPLPRWDMKEHLDETKALAITSVNDVIVQYNTSHPATGKIPTRHVVARHLLPVPSQCSHQACGRKEVFGLKLKVCSRCYGRK